MRARFFRKVNVCFPLLDERLFRDQYRNARDRLCPSLLCCLYANACTYWSSSPELAPDRRPDQRYIWNLSVKSIYTELHLCPGMSTITASLIDVLGRPCTCVIGNGVLMSSSVALAHSLGLNRSPLSWNIPEVEKRLRIKIWWSLTIQDRW